MLSMQGITQIKQVAVFNDTFVILTDYQLVDSQMRVQKLPCKSLSLCVAKG